MHKGSSILATACARGNSKGLKNKNIRLLNNKPLICYTLDIIKESTIVDDYIISTDSDDIIKIVKDYGFDVYFKRPRYLAGDKVSRLEAVRHACLWAEDNFKRRYDIVVDLGVSTPLKTSEDLENAVKLLVNAKASNVFSVTLSRRNPYYNMVEKTGNRVSLVKALGKKIIDRRDAPEVYDMNDGISAWKRGVLFSNMPQFNKDTKIYIMPNIRSIDIDEEFDFNLAEFLIKRTEKR